jgi:hypothetical protein
VAIHGDGRWAAAVIGKPSSEERALARVSRDNGEAVARGPWFETALKKRLLTMRFLVTSI